MKQLLLLAGLVSATSAWAQAPITTVLSVGAFGLAPNAGLQLERRLSPHFSLAVQGARYFGSDYPGYQAALLGRYYFRAAAPAGFYAQAQFGVFQHDGHVLSSYPDMKPGPPGDVRLGGPGGGLGLGYQLLLGQHLALNAGLGLKYYHIRSLNICDCGYVGDWYAVGQPGSMLDGQLNIGYAF